MARNRSEKCNNILNIIIVIVLAFAVLAVAFAYLTRFADPANGAEFDALMLSTYLVVEVALIAALVYAAFIMLRERKRARQLALYRTMEHSGVFSVNMDEDLTLTYGNDKYYQMIEYTPEQLKSEFDNKSRRYIHPGDIDMVRARINKALQNNEGYTQWVMRILTGSGGQKYVLTSGTFEKRGQLAVMNGVLVDITEQKHAELDLTVQKQITDIALGNTNLSVWEYEYSSDCAVLVSKATDQEAVLNKVEHVSESIFTLCRFDKESERMFRDILATLPDKPGTIDGVFKLVPPDCDEQRHLHVTVTNLVDDSQKPYRAIAVVEDVTELHDTELAYLRELAFRKAVTSDMFATALIGVTRGVVLSMDSPVYGQRSMPDDMTFVGFFTKAAESVVEDEGIRRYFNSLTPRSFEEDMAAGRTTVSFEFLGRKGQGEEAWFSYESHLLADPGSKDLILFIYIKDAGEARREIERQTKAAQCDMLTGMLNHTAAINAISKFLANEGSGGTHALFVVDVDNFKTVNDAIGHHKGDVLIERLSTAVKECFDAADVIGRLGGDEFMILMKNALSKKFVASKAAELVEALQFDCMLEDVRIPISASVGICMYGGGDCTFDLLYRKANDALFSAKREGKNQYCIIDYVEDEDIDEPDLYTEQSNNIQLRTLLENMDAGVVMLEVGEKIRAIYASESYYKLDGAMTDITLGTGNALGDYIHPDDRAAFFRAVRAGAESSESFSLSYRVAAFGGSYIWRHLKAVRVAYPGKTQPVILGVVTDISQLKQATAQLEAIVNNSPCGIALVAVGEHIRMLFSNDELFNMAGYAREEYENTLVNDTEAAIAEEDRQAVREALHTSKLEKRATSYKFRTAYGKNDGVRNFAGRAVYMEDTPDGEPTYLCAIVDETESTRLLKRLADGNERLRSAFDQTCAVMWEVDVKARRFAVWDVNGGVYRDDLIFENIPNSLTDADWVHPEYKNQFIEFINEILSGRGEGSLACIVRYFRNATYGWASLSYHMTYDENGEPNKAIGVSREFPNIYNEQGTFINEQNFGSAASKRLFRYLRVNLSQNTVESYCVADTVVGSVAGAKYTEILQKACAAAYGENDRMRITERASIEALTAAYKNGIARVDIEYRRRSAGGAVRWYSNTIVMMTDPISGDLYGFVYLRDIDVRKHWEMLLPVNAQMDSTMLIYAEDTLRRMINSVIDARRDTKASCILALINIDGVDEVVSTHGISVKNRILALTGRVFRTYLDGENIVGCGSGYSIVVFMPDVSTVPEAESWLEGMINEVIAVRASLSSFKAVSMSFGIASAEYRDASFDELYRRAANAQGRGIASADAEATVDTVDAAAESSSALTLPQTAMSAPKTESWLLHDLQTGLLNRQSYYDMLKSIRLDSLKDVGVLYADINELSRLNRDFGNKYGDILISFIADTLTETFGGAYIYRISGGEFVVLVTDTSYEGFNTLCKTASGIWDVSYPGCVSIGWTWSDKVANLQMFIDRAYDMMRAEKSKRRGLGEQTSMHTFSSHRRWLMDGMENGLFKVYFQPEVNVTTGEVVAAEALVRYLDEQQGVIEAEKFVPLLENEDLIKYLDFYVLSDTLHMLYEARGAGKRMMPVAVNFSRKTMVDPSTLETALDARRRYPEIMPFIEFEVTESMNNVERSAVERACEQFREEGFKIALDDFASKYSGLHILSALRFDSVKIDRSVIDDIVDSKVNRIIVEGVVRICEEMDVRCVAEGVELEDQKRVLKELGCNVIQGFLIDKPMPANEFAQSYMTADGGGEGIPE